MRIQIRSRYSCEDVTPGVEDGKTCVFRGLRVDWLSVFCGPFALRLFLQRVLDTR